MYGKGFEAYFKVLKLIKDGKMRIMGNGENHIPFVYSGDVAKAIRSSITKGNGIYLLVGECLTQNEVYSIAAKELGVEPPSKHLSPMLSMGFAEFELLKSTIFKTVPKFIPEDIAVLSSDRIFDCKKAKEELGFDPTPLANGIKEMVALLKSQEESK
jgi:nucleoside-diphosphate-sugar epimerase